MGCVMRGPRDVARSPRRRQGLTVSGYVADGGQQLRQWQERLAVRLRSLPGGDHALSRLTPRGRLRALTRPAVRATAMTISTRRPAAA
jgi:hypothetical protein